MKNYFVNKHAQENGDHEVYTSFCDYLPKNKNSISLGQHSNCFDAIRKSRQNFNVASVAMPATLVNSFLNLFQSCPYNFIKE